MSADGPWSALPGTPLIAGSTLPEISHPITQDGIAAYAAASGDHNPIHLDEAFARAAGLPGTIAHGMLSFGLLATSLERWVAGRGRVTALHCRFAGMVRPGDHLRCRGTVRSASADGRRLELELEAVTDLGVRALTHARATIEMDGPPAAPGADDGD